MLKTIAPYICNSCSNGSHENCNSNGGNCECGICQDSIVFCSEEGCENEVYQNGLCYTHHDQSTCKHPFATYSGGALICPGCGRDDR